MGRSSPDGLPPESHIREQVLQMWSQWLRWATSCPEKRRALALLDLADEITAESHQTASDALAEIRTLLERSREHGPLRATPLAFVVALLSALADATIDFTIRDSANADEHRKSALDALWRMVA